MRITMVKVVSVPVSDQDRAKDFYLDVLGFELVADERMGPDMRWVQVRPPGAQTSLTLVTWFASMPAGSMTGLVVETDDIRAEYESLEAGGVVFDGPVQEQPWGTFATFTDPDGNGLVLQQSAG